MKTFRWIMMTLLLGVLGLQSVMAQVIGSNIVVTVTPDHQDWNYRVGEKAHFVVNVRKSGTLLDNVVWAWSPNLSDNKTIEAFMERYPGDDYVNLMGVDIYEFDDNDTNYQTNLKETLDILVQAARQQGKLAALTETGCRGISKKRDWFTKTLFPVLQSYPLSYVLFWRNAWDKPQEEAYLPGINDGEIVKDFQKLKAEKKILFANDVKKVKK